MPILKGVDGQIRRPLERARPVGGFLRTGNRPDVHGADQLPDGRLRRLFRFRAGVVGVLAQYRRRTVAPLGDLSNVRPAGRGLGLQPAGLPVSGLVAHSLCFHQIWPRLTAQKPVLRTVEAEAGGWGGGANNGCWWHLRIAVVCGKFF